jgi:membrane protease YdiL (CAAX protease family)
MEGMYPPPGSRPGYPDPRASYAPPPPAGFYAGYYSPAPPPVPQVPQGSQRRPGPVLDRTVAEIRQQDRSSWTFQTVVLPIAATVAVIALGLALASSLSGTAGTARTVAAVVLNIAPELLLLAVAYLAGRTIAARNGGWARTFGLAGLTRRDLLWALAAFGAVFLARIWVGVVATILSGGRAAAEAQNIKLSHVTPLAVTVLLISGVLLAPVLEELIFRGLVLRGLMRRMPFWPAAIISTVVFGLFHTYEVDTLAGAITLAASVSTLGLANCLLNRITNRLSPGMLVHAATNLLATLLLIALA